MYEVSLAILSRVGKTTGDDPFTPSWRLIGGYWQWGMKGPDESQWYDTNTSNFAHGPTGPNEADANDEGISNWNVLNYADEDVWSDDEKASNDPCPSGYRMPTADQWQGVLENNTQSEMGTWSISETNYDSGRFFGDDLMLPAAGYRIYYTNGSLGFSGYNGNYWSSTEDSNVSDYGWFMNFGSSYAQTASNRRMFGFSVRCIAE